MFTLRNLSEGLDGATSAAQAWTRESVFGVVSCLQQGKGNWVIVKRLMPGEFQGLRRADCRQRGRELNVRTQVFRHRLHSVGVPTPAQYTMEATARGPVHRCSYEGIDVQRRLLANTSRVQERQILQAVVNTTVPVLKGDHSFGMDPKLDNFVYKDDSDRAIYIDL